jgi:glycosyltransferase involved in cell wall biosynthesis
LQRIISKDELRIGVDGSVFCFEQMTGISRYAFELSKPLQHLLPRAQFFVYSAVPMSVAPFSRERWTYRTEGHLRRDHRLRRILLHGPWAEPRWHMTRVPRLCRTDSLDIFWATTTLAPALRQPTKIVSTVYDLNHLLVSRTMRLNMLWLHRLFFRLSLRRAAAITAISRGTAERLSSLLGLKTAAIVTPAVSDAFCPRPADQVELCLRTYGITRPYFLAVATREPRKNLDLLVKTFVRMKEDGLVPEHRLVLVGNSGWKNRQLDRLLSLSAREDISCLGYVKDHDLALLYTGADVFVFPSIYEGFGIPVLEARACGTPVVTTDIPELREAGGRDAIYILPDEIHLREAMLQAISIPRLNRYDRGMFPTWEDEAAKLATLFCQMANSDYSSGA